MNKSNLPEKIDALVLDFDGVLTDNKVYLSQDGIESVRCDRSDGQGIKDVIAAGIPVMVLSREENPVVRVRCQKLGIECIHGELHKAERLKQVAKEKGWQLDHIIYVGNDLPDIPVMKIVGCGISVADGYPAVIEIADRILSKDGGTGAVRELCDEILQKISP